MKIPHPIPENLIKYVCAMALFPVAAMLLPIQRIINHVFHPGYSACGRCERTWDVVEGHSTTYGDAKWKVKGDGNPNSIISIPSVPNDGEWHDSIVAGGMACFPLCESCWQELGTPEARLPYYRALVDSWKQWDGQTGEKAEDRWPAIKAAVLSEK